MSNYKYAGLYTQADITPELLASLRSKVEYQLSSNEKLELNGISDVDEVVNHCVMMYLEGRKKLHGGNMNLCVAQAIEELTATTMPERDVKSGTAFHQRGVYNIQQMPEDYEPVAKVDHDPSELNMILPLILQDMPEESRKMIEFHLIHPDNDDKAELLDISLRSVQRKLKQARIDFLKAIPEGTKLHKSSLSLQEEYGTIDPYTHESID